MITKRLWNCLCLSGLGVMVAGSTGCQTQIAGMTLPTGYYLQHRPQYFPEEPDFPLERELGTMQAQTAAAIAAAAPRIEAPVPPPVVPPAVPLAPGAAAPAPPPR